MKHLALLMCCLVFTAACGQADAATDQTGLRGPAAASSVSADRSSGPDGTVALTASDVVKVFKTPSCGCCKGWVAHLEAEGFEVEVEDLNDLTPVKDRMGVPTELRSCHTAEVDGLVIEGHVPAETIRETLANRGDLSGIAVPGMPIGSPGMEVPGRAPDAYQVIGYTTDGDRRVVAQH